MWVRLSLKGRLTLLFALLLVAGLALNVARLFSEAGPRVAAEDESSLRLATDFVRSAAPAVEAAPDPAQALAGLVRSLRNLRHVTVTLSGDSAGPQPAADADLDAVPAWFVALVRPEQIATAVPMQAQGHWLATIAIASNPLDEIGEIWDGIMSQVMIDCTVAAVLVAVTFFTVNRALAPIGDLSRAMERIGEGHYDTRVRPSGPPEFAAICRQLNRLAVVLGSTVDEKQRLAERIVTLQDDERHDLARELHDEFGPYLFAIRAEAAALGRAVAVGATAEADAAHGVAAEAGARRPRDVAKAIADQVDALQKCNRRVLDKLRPVALDDLGLDAALTALVAGWREARPQVVVDWCSAVDLEDLDSTTGLTLYRVVQEGLTNAFRHADATRIALTIDRSEPDGCLRIRMNDNGIGLPEDFRDGLGLTGMRERLAALRGRLRLGASPQGGVELEALIPPPRR